MPLYREWARAKINLTLTVNGRRPDGYHDLLSLVAFADAGDAVTLDNGNSRNWAFCIGHRGTEPSRDRARAGLEALARH